MLTFAASFPTSVNFDLGALLGSKPDIHTAPTFERQNILPHMIHQFSRAATKFSFALIFRVLPKILCSLQVSDGQGLIFSNPVDFRKNFSVSW